MSSEICPKCGAIIRATDTHCMECGVDIAKYRRELAEREKRERGGPRIDPNAPAATGAMAGLGAVGETSEKVRLKAFDKQLANKLARERAAVIVTAVLGLTVGVVVLLVGLGTVKSAGGYSAIRELSYGALREQSLGAFANMSLTGSILLLVGFGGLLCALGQSIRVIAATQAIAAVKRGVRPEVVSISRFTKAGLLLGSLLVPPFGLVLGIIFKLGRDEETRKLGGSMIWAAIITIGFIAANLAWDLVAGFARSAAVKPAASANAVAP